MPNTPHKPGPRSIAVGANVRRVRTERGLSQTALAEQMGWSQNIIAKLEGAVTNMRVEQLLDLATALDVAPAELLKGAT